MPYEEPQLDPAERELEEALRGLQPRRDDLARDRLMYALGQAAARRRVRRWQAGSLAAVLALAASLGMHWVATPGPESASSPRVAREEPSAPSDAEAGVQMPTASPTEPDSRPRWPDYMVGLGEYQDSIAHFPEMEDALPPMSYLAVRDRVLAHGVDALPELPAAASPEEPFPAEWLAQPQRTLIEVQPSLFHSLFMPENQS